jgi:hypothetical protein
MANCHLCGAGGANKVPHRGDFKCPYCHATKGSDGNKLHYCRKCAWWEIGPLPAPGALPEALEGEDAPPPEDEAVGEPEDVPLIKTPCATDRPEKMWTRHKLNENRKTLFKELKKKCDLVKGQLGNEAWKTAVNEACKLYDYLYFDRKATGAKAAEANKRRTMVHTLIVVYLSAYERCKEYKKDNDKYIHRHDAPRFAEKHLGLCFFDEEGTLIPTGKQDLCKKVLGHEIIERYLKGKLSVAQAHQHYRGLGLALAQGQEWFQLSAMVYHCCTGRRAPDAPKGTFDPLRAHGYLSKEHKEELYGADPSGQRTVVQAAHLPLFQDGIKDKLGTLYATLGWSDVPGGDRFPDGDVDGIGDLQALQKAYLKSIPKFDHTGLGRAGAPECEKNVRKRVLHRLRQVFSDQIFSADCLANYIAAEPRVQIGQERTAAIAARDLARTDKAALGAGALSARLVQADAKLEQLKTLRNSPGGGFEYNKKMTELQVQDSDLHQYISLDQQAEEHEKKATELQAEINKPDPPELGLASLRGKYKIVLERYVYDPGDGNAFRGNAALDDLVDKIIQDMRGQHHWVESTATDGMFQAYVDAGGERSNFRLMNETERKEKQIKWDKVFPAKCIGDDVGTFTGLEHQPSDLADRVDGRQDAKDWYLDWRVDKDRVMYDCHDFPFEQLPNFTSFTLWLKSEPPHPNYTYGHHMVVWDPQWMNLNRAVLSLGDRGVPRRSVLLLLQDILCKIPRKDGTHFDYAQGAHWNKFHIFERLMLHVEHMGGDADGLNTKTRFLNRMDALPSPPKKGDGTFEFGPQPPDTKRKRPWINSSQIENLEMHVFGDVKISQAAALIMRTQGTDYDGPTKTNKAHDSSALVTSVGALQVEDGIGWGIRKYKMENPQQEGRPAGLVDVPFLMEGERKRIGAGNNRLEELLKGEPGEDGEGNPI